MAKEEGKKVCLRAIDDPQGPFVKGNIYVFALTMDNVVLAHPYEKSLKRMNLSTVKDSVGTYFFARFKEVAENPGSGWVKYTWAKPGGSEAVPKTSFIKRVPGEDMYIGSGYYAQ
jgi:cytochrome c